MSMNITVELPVETQRRLEADHVDLNGFATEALLVALYRDGRIARLDLANALSLDVVETEALLHRHRVTEDLGTLADYANDLAMLRGLRARVAG